MQGRGYFEYLASRLTLPSRSLMSFRERCIISLCGSDFMKYPRIDMKLSDFAGIWKDIPESELREAQEKLQTLWTGFEKKR
jgi:hypothetical protein